MKLVMYYTGSDKGFDSKIEEISQCYQGKLIDKEFLKGETTLMVEFQNEGQADHFFQDSKRFASKIGLDIARSGFEDIGL